VSGSWTVPTVTSSSSGTTYSSVWVGIDGFNSSTVEQVGTEEDIENGHAVYNAWWEMYSSGKQQPEQVITGMTVDPGDSITASVQYITTGAHAGQFLLSITDSSHANDSFSTYETSSQVQSPQASRSSAEWVIEAPTVGNNISALANFGAVTFTNASATINGVTGPINSSSWQSEAINIGSGGAIKDVTSILYNSGTSFTVSYNSSASSSSQSGSAGGISRKATHRIPVGAQSSSFVFSRPQVGQSSSTAIGTLDPTMFKKQLS
jgi:Peptidase A4 family